MYVRLPFYSELLNNCKVLKVDSTKMAYKLKIIDNQYSELRALIVSPIIGD